MFYNKDMISVVIPSYNREKLLERSIQSVLNQSFEDIQVIIVDNGSTDGTEELVRSLKDKRIEYIYAAEKHGASYARNVGIDHAKGEFIAFQDSDDVWHPDKLKEQIGFLKYNAADIVFCAINRYKEDQYVDRYPSELKEGKVSYEDMLKKSLASTQTILGKKECFLKQRFNEDLKRLVDWDLMIRMTAEYEVYYQDSILVDVYNQKDSIISDPLLLFDSMRHIFDSYIRSRSEEIVNSNVDRLFSGYEALMQEYRSLEQRHEEVLNSRAWKLTAPLRKLKDLIKKQE